jgi:O-antigen/teichoic acid export membrane protein
VLLLAYVVRRVSVHDYGIYLLAQSLAAFLYLIELGIGSVLVPLYVSTFAEKGIEEVSRLASTLIITLLSLGAAGACVISAAACLVPRLLHLPTGETELAVQVVIIASFAVMLALPLTPLEQLCQAFHRFDRANQVQMAATALRIVLSVAVLAAGKGIVALAAVQVAVSLFRLASMWMVAPTAVPGLSLRLSFDGGLLPKVVGMSRWAFGDDLSRRIGMNSEQVILGALSSFQQVALFGVGSRLPAHMHQFAARGLSVLFPALSEHYAKSDTARLRSTFSKALHICVTGFVPIATFAAICATPLMTVWAGPAYEKAGPVLAWLLISSLSTIVMLPSDLVLYSHGRIPQAARFSVVETLGKIAVAILLAVRYGAAGVAAGVAIWHWCVNLFLYLPAACRVAEMRPYELWSKTLLEHSPKGNQPSSNVMLGGAYVAGAAILAAGLRQLSTSEMLLLCVVICLLYSAVWISYTVLPMWRQAGTRASAIP